MTPVIQPLKALAGLLIGGILAVTALTWGYTRNATISLEMDREVPGVVTGLYGAERVGRETFAWTRRTATMTLPGLDRRREWSCTIRLRGGRADESTLPLVLIAVDGAIAATVQTTNDYQDVTVPVRPRPQSSGAVVTLTASNTFVPGPGDRRELGVMLDRWSCAPASTGFIRPPRAAITAAAAGGAAFGAAFALIGAGVVGILSGAAVLGLAQAVPLGWEFGTFTPYSREAAWLAIWIAALLVVAVRGTERVIRRPLSTAARLVTACTAAVLYLKLLALLHPSKPVIDAVFHAHRLQWVLEGRFYFTQPMPSGVRFPYAIGLYVFAAPWSLVTDDYVLLLRIVVSTAEALCALLVYLLVSRIWGDRLSAAIAAMLFHLVPRTFEIVGNANMTNAFAQSVAFAAMAAAVLWPLHRGKWLQLAALTVVIAWALLSHISTLTLLGAILLTLAALYWFRGGKDLRGPALSVFTALVVAAGLSVLLYYAHFGEAYRSAARVRASTAGPASGGSTSEPATPATPAAPRGSAPVGLADKVVEAGRLTVAAVGWPIFLMALIGVPAFWARGVRDRLSLGILALFLTFLIFASSVVLTPVERSFQRYAAEFISRVTLATYPAAVILAGLGAGTLWRAGWFSRVLAAGLLLAAAYVGTTTWIEWLH